MTEHAVATDLAAKDESKRAYEATREVRFGVVLYGGVSLAIYMNGVVQELYRLVRATAPANDGKALRWPNDSLRGSESVYRELGQRLVDGQLGVRGGEPGPVRTRFVVDLLSGASAGGINGVFLAKALVRDHSLDSLEQLWVDKGDINKLLNDRVSNAELKGRGVGTADKSSLLNSKWMYLQLLSAIQNLNPDVRRDVGVNTPVQPSPYADAIDLWVSTTDLEGRIDTVNTSGAPNGAIKERSNRTLLHFAYASEKAAGYSPRDDFDAENDPLLAFAARATSSFPAAFEPARISDIQEAASALDAGTAWRDRFEGFFPRYAEDKAEEHSFADGGYLDNKPFEQIMRTLPLRRSSLPVTRQILYVEPDPGSPPQLAAKDSKQRRPDIVATLLAVLTTPRNETIADNVADIRQFGAKGKARQAAYDRLTQALELELRAPADADLTGDRAEPASSEADLRDRALQFVAQSPAARAYRAARDVSVRADIAALLARVLPEQPRDEGTPLHAAFIDFVDHIAVSQPVLQNDQPRACFDVLFHLRRLNFLQRSASLSNADPADVCEFRQDLDEVFGAIRTAARAVRQPRSVKPSQDEYTKTVDAVVDAFDRKGVDFGPESSPNKTQLAEAYRDSAELQKAITSLLEAARDRLDLAAHEAKALEVINEHPSLSDVLLPRMYFYELYDQISLSFDDLPGENSDIPVTRISPLDATELVTDAGKRLDKLAGSALSHFGGFFDESWRRNDILWGRLDAAERIIDALVPADMVVDRCDLIKRAQIEILREAWADPATRRHVLAPIVENIAAPRPVPKSQKKTTARKGDDRQSESPAPEISMEDLRNQLAKTPRAKGGPTTQEWSDLSARALRVVNNVGTYVSVGSLDKHPLVTVAARLAKLGANVLDFVTGRGLKSTVLRNAVVLLAIVGLTIGVIGVVHGPTSLTRTGFTLLAAMLLVRAVADTVVDRLAGSHTRLRAFTRVTFLLFTAAAVGGVIVLHNRYPEWRPLLFTAIPALVVLLVNLVSNKRFKPWFAALIAVFGAMVYLAFVVATNPTELWRVIHK